MSSSVVGAACRSDRYAVIASMCVMHDLFHCALFLTGFFCKQVGVEVSSTTLQAYDCRLVRVCTTLLTLVQAGLHGCSRNAMFGQLDTPPKIFFHAWIHIATAHPVFLLPYYGLRKRSIAMCVS